MQYRPSSIFPPNPPQLQVPQAANGPHMTQSGPSAQGKVYFQRRSRQLLICVSNHFSASTVQSVVVVL